METNFSFKETILCQHCNIPNYYAETRIMLSDDGNPFRLEDFSRIINSYFCNRNTCFWCKHQELTIIREFGPYLIIDMEDKRITEFVQKIPTELNILDKNFLLIGVITAIERKDINEVQYIAYCRSLTNVWYEHNNIKRHVKRLANVPKTKILLIMYILL